jgi:hypothetical protein
MTMPDSPFSQLAFKELHLFPRALFVFGGICIVSGIVRAERTDILLGLALFFGAIGINILYDLRRAQAASDSERSVVELRWMKGFYRTVFAMGVLAFLLLLYVFAKDLGYLK